MYAPKRLLFIILAIFFCNTYTEGKNFAEEYLSISDSGYQKKIIVQILDEYGKPTYGKIRITNGDSDYYAPDGHVKEFQIIEKGEDAMLVNNRRFAYVEGTFRIDLPAADLRFEVVKGYAYRFFDSIIHISPETDSIKIQLLKWFNFPKAQ